MKKRKKNEKAVGAGRMLAWQSRAVSQGCVLMAVGYLTIYCTDTLKMPPALVGTLLVISKLLDGATDIVAGYIVDRTNTKWGKGRPYELCIIGMWLSTWFMFSCRPSFSLVAKSAWVLCAYVLVNSVFYTFLNANATVYMVRAFKYEEQYVAVNTYGNFISVVGVLVFNIVFPMAVAKYAVTAAGWSKLIAVIGCPMTIIGMMRFLFIKETVNVDRNVETNEKEKVNLTEVKKILTRNPFIYMVALTLFVMNFVSSMGVGTYYFKYIVGDLSKLGVITAVQAISIPMLFVYSIIIKKLSTAKLIFIGCLFSVAGGIINFIAMGNMALLGIGALCTGIGSAPIGMVSMLLIVECADYNEWKGLQRMEGTLGSVTGFASKVGAALGSGALGILLTLSGYVGDAEIIPDTAIMMLRSLNGLIPAALWVLVAAGMWMYQRLDKLMPEIKRSLAENHEAAHQ